MLNKSSTIVPFVDLSDQKLRDHDDHLLEDDDSSAFESLDDEEISPDPKQISPEIESILIPKPTKPVIKPAKKRVRILLPRQEDPQPVIAKKSKVIKIKDDDNDEEDFSSLGRNYGSLNPSNSSQIAEKLALLEEERKVLQQSIRDAQAKEVKDYDQEAEEDYADEKKQLEEDKEHILKAECRLIYYYQIMALHNEGVVKRLEADMKAESDDNRIRALARLRDQFTD